MTSLHSNKNIFKPLVSDAVISHIRHLVENIDFEEILGSLSFNIQGDSSFPAIFPIYGVESSGWFPWQDGGFVLDVFLSNISSGSYFTKGEEDFCTRLIEQAHQDFCDDLGLDSVNDIDFSDDLQITELDDFVSDWISDQETLFRLEIFVKGLSVVVRTSINYKDIPYFRGEFEEILKCEIYTYEEFLQLTTENIHNQFKI